MMQFDCDFFNTLNDDQLRYLYDRISRIVNGQYVFENIEKFEEYLSEEVFSRGI